MSSSLSELRNFRLNKAANISNGANVSNKLATGRKRICAMSDSSDDEHTKKQPRIESTSSQQPSNQPTIENGEADERKLNVKDKEERFHLFRAIVDKTIDSLVLQDFLVQNDWDVQKAYDALKIHPKYQHLIESSPVKSTAPLNNSSPSISTNRSSELNKVQKKHKVCEN